MNKCFITKLPSSVDNDNLPVLGQLRINWLKDSTIFDARQRRITLGSNDNITVKVSGAYFTNDKFTSNLGNTKTITAADGNVSLYVSNNADAVLTIDNKYSLTYISFMINQWDNVSKPIYFNLDDIKYCTNINALALNYTKVSGDISALSNLTNLSDLYLGSTDVSGDISALSNLTNITQLQLQNTNVTGSISSLSKLTKLSVLDIVGRPVSGVYDDFAPLISLKSIRAHESEINSGTLSKLPKSLEYITLPDVSSCTWNKGERTNGYVFGSNTTFPLSNVDDFLIDMATCNKGTNTSTFAHTINIKGNRTSASDSALAKLQELGYTVTIYS